MIRLRELGWIRQPGRSGRGVKRSASATYRKTAREYLRRELVAGEIVHHVDLNPLNNEVKNLAVVSRQRHSDLHKELEMLSIALYKKGLVTFSVESGYQPTAALLSLTGI